MTHITEVLIGLDVGTTSSKALVREVGRSELALVEARTPWTTVARVRTETTAAALLELAVGLLRDALAVAEQRCGRVRVLGVGVAGLGESGVLLDPAGTPCAPVIAWFDQRGIEQVDRISSRATDFGEQFARRTGLPWDCQASVAKLLWMQDTGFAVTSAHRWASVPEWIVHRLGGELVTEPSLASRTGLVDQRSGAVWGEGACAVGLPPTLLSASLHGDAAADGGYDIVVEATGSTEIGDMCVPLTRNGGTVLIYGVTRGDEVITFHPFDVFRREITIKGSFAEMTSFGAAIAALRAGRARTDGIITHRFPLDEYGKALDALANDRTAHKIVLVP